MAFNFGTPQASGFGAFGQNSGTTAFGATSTPAFGASSTPAFGASSTPAFGASPTPAFGSSSTPAFGAPGTPGFGASSSAFSFAAASTPAFGAKSAGAFSFPSPSPPSFSASTPAFGQLNSTQFGQQQHPQQQQQYQLSTKNNQPISDSTAWDDINEQSQQNLLQLEYVPNCVLVLKLQVHKSDVSQCLRLLYACRKCIIQYRNERQELAACRRLQEDKDSKQVSHMAQAPACITASITASIVTLPVARLTGSLTSHHKTKG